VADGVQVVLGPDSNAQVLANLTAAETASVLQLTSATSAQISRTESGDYVFQIRASDDALARSAADFLVNTREMTRFATVAANTDYGLDSIDAFADVIESADDGDILLQLEHDVRDTDMAPFAEQIVNSGAEAVAVWTTEPAAASLLAALDSLGWTGTFVYGYLTPEFVEANAAQTVELIGPVTWWPSSQAWTSLDFSARFSDRYNSEPGPQSAAYYDAVYLLQRAIRESGGAVGDIQTWLLDLTGLTGAQGTYEPERYAGGELTRSVLIIGAEGGVVTELSRYNAETCVAVCE
jgi:branched-chain amino acid transport system substrate-binding protein